RVAEQFGRLDIAIANAGVGAYGPFLELAPEHLEEMIDLNLKGTLYTAAATLPHLIEAGGGDFVSLASVAGLRISWSSDRVKPSWTTRCASTGCGARTC